jgi:hypothetical protein
LSALYGLDPHCSGRRLEAMATEYSLGSRRSGKGADAAIDAIQKRVVRTESRRCPWISQLMRGSCRKSSMPGAQVATNWRSGGEQLYGGNDGGNNEGRSVRRSFRAGFERARLGPAMERHALCRS